MRLSLIHIYIIVKNKLQYDYDYKNAEDYCMWINMISLGKFAKLDEALVKYRISDAQVSQPYNLQTIKSVMEMCIRDRN